MGSAQKVTVLRGVMINISCTTGSYMVYDLDLPFFHLIPPLFSLNRRDNCYKCLVFNEKHENVMQYKESEWINDEFNTFN